MSKGISKQQRAILNALAEAGGAMSAGDLVFRLYGLNSTRSQEVSLRRALYSLTKRDLVHLATCVIEDYSDGTVRARGPDKWFDVSAVASHNRGRLLVADLPDRKELFFGFNVLDVIGIIPEEDLKRIRSFGRSGKPTRQHLRVCVVNGDDMPHRMQIRDDWDGAILFDGVLAEQQSIIVNPSAVYWRDGDNYGDVWVQIGNLTPTAEVVDLMKLTLKVTDDGIAGDTEMLSPESFLKPVA